MNPPATPSPLGIPAILVKILVSLLSGGLAYLLTNLSEEPQVWVLTISVFIAGVVLVVQFIVDFDERIRVMEQRQSDHYRHMEGIVEQGFTKINEATQLFGLVEASELRTDHITQLVRNSTEIKPTEPPLVFDVAQTEINRLSMFLKELSGGGTVSYEGEDRDWLLALARNVRSSLDATSLSTVDAGGRGFDGGFWFTDLGHRYLNIQGEILQRGVRIRRVFILDRSELAQDSLFIRMCKLQRDIGINVRILDASRDATPPSSSLFDFVLFDESISYEITPTARASQEDHRTFVNTRLDLQQPRVKERVRNFNLLWDSATEPDL